ncbi:receptor-type tyrosine-protein phosphatase T-like [Atheta coriaria]|uniref:receptor-type tyrosine-protein phosphatase T-like n=1 Tax=Dalotia coriaria TaxID=877792 RepID=UPI0031F35496
MNVQLQSGSNKEITVKFMELQGWSLDVDVPENMRIFITARLQMTRMKCTKFNSVLVMCRNGADGSGLYIAACNLIDSILTEQVVDVCMIVRRIRSNRTQFITNKKQLHALYEVATFFLSDFTKYHYVSTLPIRSKLRNCIE